MRDNRSYPTGSVITIKSWKWRNFCTTASALIGRGTQLWKSAVNLFPLLIYIFMTVQRRNFRQNSTTDFYIWFWHLLQNRFANQFDKVEVNLRIVVMRQYVDADVEQNKNDNCFFFSFDLYRVYPDTRVQEKWKLIDFYSKLLGLFSLFCFLCQKGTPKITVTRSGTMAVFIQREDHGLFGRWSQSRNNPNPSKWEM